MVMLNSDDGKLLATLPAEYGSKKRARAPMTPDSFSIPVVGKKEGAGRN
jgi:hypothetical protein